MASNLTLPSREDINGTHFSHCHPKLHSPFGAMLSIVQYHSRGGRATQQCLVRSQQPMVLLQLDVVSMVETIRCRKLQCHCRLLTRRRRRAFGLQVSRVIGVHGRVLWVCCIEGMKPVREGGAVRYSNGMCAGKCHHLRRRQPSLGEAVNQLIGIERGKRESLGFFFYWDATVAATGWHGVADTSNFVGAITSCKGKNVGARHGVGTNCLDFCLRFVDNLETS